VKSIINLHVDAISDRGDGKTEVVMRVIGAPDTLHECAQAYIRSGMVAYRGGMEAEVPAEKITTIWQSLEEIRSLVLANRANIERLFEKVGGNVPMAAFAASPLLV
jgi:hypothetical protein